MKKNNSLASVIIVNYNNSRYLKRSINSVINQSYVNTELIVVDNNSNDGSIEIIKKFKDKLKLISNKKRNIYGCFNQIDCIKMGLKESKGKIIFFLDSDDFFRKNKISILMNEFNNKNYKVIFDKSIFYYNKKNQKKINLVKRTNFITPWPRFYSQSCISIKKNYLNQVLPKIKIKKFPDIWFDFRLAMQTYLEFGKINILDNYLTYYQQSKNQASSKFKKFSKNWWKRRKEAHKYTNYLHIKNNIKKNKNLDELVTNIVNSIVKK